MKEPKYLPTALEIDPDATLDELRQLAGSLGLITSGHQWWVGDVLVAAERHGEEGSQVEADLGIEPGTAQNWRWVAGRFEPSRRRDKPLTFSHHAETARLEPDDQTKMLDRAAAEHWTVRQLRDAVALEHPTGREPGERSEPMTDAEHAAITRRLETLACSVERWHDETERDPARLHEYVDGDDVEWLIRTLRIVTRGATA